MVRFPLLISAAGLSILLGIVCASNVVKMALELRVFFESMTSEQVRCRMRVLNVFIGIYCAFLTEEIIRFVINEAHQHDYLYSNWLLSSTSTITSIMLISALIYLQKTIYGQNIP